MTARRSEARSFQLGKTSRINSVPPNSKEDSCHSRASVKFSSRIARDDRRRCLDLFNIASTRPAARNPVSFSVLFARSRGRWWMTPLTCHTDVAPSRGSTWGRHAHNTHNGSIRSSGTGEKRPNKTNLSPIFQLNGVVSQRARSPHQPISRLATLGA